MSNKFNFTDQAQKTMDLAKAEAIRFNHSYIGTEHILLALVQDQSEFGTSILRGLGLEAAKVRREIDKLVQPGPRPVTTNEIPLTPRARRAIDIAFAKARLVHQQEQVGMEHLILGLLCERDGVAGQILRNFGLKPDEVVEAVLKYRLLQMKIVERTVRPVRASVARKRKMREELLAHLEGIYSEEYPQFNDPMAAIDAAAKRFGDPAELSAELERALPWSEKLSYHLERRFGWRAPESATRWMLRLATQVFLIISVCTGLLVGAVTLRLGSLNIAWIATGPAVAVLIFAPLDLFLLGVLYYRARDAMFGVFGARRSRFAAFICALMAALIVMATGFGSVAIAERDLSLGLRELYPSSVAAVLTAAALLITARVSGSAEIRDAVWACLDLNNSSPQTPPDGESPTAQPA